MWDRKLKKQQKKPELLLTWESRYGYDISKTYLDYLGSTKAGGIVKGGGPQATINICSPLAQKLNLWEISTQQFYQTCTSAYITMTTGDKRHTCITTPV